MNRNSYSWLIQHVLARFCVALLMVILALSINLHSQDLGALRLSEFHPSPKLRVPTSDLHTAKFPVVDVHSHFHFKFPQQEQSLDDFVSLMDRNNLAICISLDGQLNDRLHEQIKFLWSKYKQRFAVFANINWQGNGLAGRYETWASNQSDFAHATVLQLQQAKLLGISGVKVFKQFGLHYRAIDGELLEIDDSRFAPIWDECGRLGLPVIMHTADPSAFFDDITPENERYEELSRHPDWHYPADRFPSRRHLHEARSRLFERHRNTTFIAAHMANDAEDLQEVADILDRFPNVYVEIASRISELGRQPYTCRDFMLRYQDRILFGTDGPWPEKRYQSYWRFLETKDEYFPYSEKEIPPQGLWQIYGVYLPDDVLRKIYSENAARIIPGIEERLTALMQ
ncbi:MAG: amidohydrolase [Planctomycetales bacterium]|nr:amidohydrolase [Planctomycetales bacterium]